MQARAPGNWHCTSEKNPVIVVEAEGKPLRFSHITGTAWSYENKDPVPPCRVNQISFHLVKRRWQPSTDNATLLLKLNFTDSPADFLKYLIEEKGFHQHRHADFDERDDYSETTLDGLGDYHVLDKSFTLNLGASYSAPQLHSILEMIWMFEPTCHLSFLLKLKETYVLM